MDRLSEDNFMMYAIKHYTNESCKGIKEFKKASNDIKEEVSKAVDIEDKKD